MVGALVFLLVSAGFVLLVLPVVNFVRTTALRRDVEALRAQLDAIERQRPGHVPQAPPPAPAVASAPAPPVPQASPETEAAPPPIPDAAAARAAVEAPVAGEPPPLETVDAAAIVGAPAMPYSAAVPDLPATPPAPAARPTVEQQIGSRGLLYTGVLILLLGVSFFLKYAFDSEWIGPAGRVALGAIAGAGLVVAGSRVAARGLARFGFALTGTGYVVLDLSIYAALDFYRLIDRPVAFALFCLVTLASTWQAHRTRDEALALIALIGGYLTPFLVGGGGNAQVALFSYDLLLGVGVLALLVRHHWLSLPVLSVLFTTLSVLAWGGEWYTESQWLTTLGFLSAFCVVFVAMLRQLRADDTLAGRVVRMVLWTTPALYHAGALIVTWHHAPALHVYLIVATAAGLLVTTDPHRGWVRLAILLAGYLPFLAYVSGPATSIALTTDAITAVALAVLHVSGLLDRSVRQEEALRSPDYLVTHVTGIGLFGLLSQIVRFAHPDWQGGIAAALAIAVSGLWFFLEARDRAAALNAAGLAFTLVALAIGAEFDGRIAVIGWGVEGAVAAWFGVRSGQAGFRTGGLALWALAAMKLSDAYALPPSAFTAVLNDRSLAAVTLVVLAYGLARAWRATAEGAAPGALDRWCPAALHVAATVVTLQWIQGETASYWAARPALPQVQLYQQLTLSLAVALYAAMLIVAGLRLTRPSLRWLGMAVVGLTVMKVFLFDLSELAGIFRVLGFMVVGVILVAVSYLYQRRSGGPGA